MPIPDQPNSAPIEPAEADPLAKVRFSNGCAPPPPLPPPLGPYAPPGPRRWWCRAHAEFHNGVYVNPASADDVCDHCGAALPDYEREALLAREQRENEPKAVTISAPTSSPAEVPRRKAYSLQEAAMLLGVSHTKVKDLVRDHKIAIVMAGARRRILDAEIDRYLLSSDRRRS